MLFKNPLYTILLAIGLFVAIAAPILIAQIQFVLDPNFIHEETRQIFYSYKWHDPSLFPNDIFIDFYSAQDLPLLYYALLSLCAYFGLFFLFFKILPIIALFVTIAALSGAAWKVGGPVSALAVGLITVYSNIFYLQIMPGIPHAYAFPILALTLLALSYKNVYALIALCIAGALLYQPIALIVGFIAGWVFFIGPKEHRGAAQNWSFIKRFLIIGATGLTSITLIFLSLTEDPESLGAGIRIMERIDEFPENGPEGRHFDGTTSPWYFIVMRQYLMLDIGYDDLVSATQIIIYPLHIILCLLIIACVIISMATTFRRQNPLHVFLPFVASIAFFTIAFSVLYPGFMYRFPFYGYYAVYPIFLYFGILRLSDFLVVENKDQRVKAITLSAILSIILLFAMDARNPFASGYYIQYDQQHRDIENFASQTPKDTVFAGFPGLHSVQTTIPERSKRSLFLFRKGHYASHESYTLTLRERAYALFDAYFAKDGDWAPLKKLHSQYGVDYLIVDTRIYNQYEDTPPSYMQPLNDHIEALWAEGKDNGFLLDSPPDIPLAFKSKDLYILDLSLL